MFSFWSVCLPGLFVGFGLLILGFSFRLLLRRLRFVGRGIEYLTYNVWVGWIMVGVGWLDAALALRLGEEGAWDGGRGGGGKGRAGLCCG
jgi:hypothetical protein